MSQNNIHLAVIEVVNRCNLQCKHCYGFFDNGSIIERKDYLNLCDQLCEVGASMITISGGEPMLLGEKIKEYIKIAKKRFKVVSVTTNGTLIKKGNIEWLNEADMVQVSIDGPEKMHDFIRGDGNFKKAVNAIRLLKQSNIKCSVMITVSNYNFPYIKNVYDLAKELDVELGFERITNTGRAEKFNSLSKNNFSKLLNIAKKYKLHSSEPINLINDSAIRKYLLKEKVLAGCMAGFMAIAIDSDLNVMPCVRLRLKVGNLKKDRLDKIFKISPVLNKLKGRDNLKGKCGRCKYKYICGGCRASAYVNKADYLSADPNCPIKI